MSTKQIDPDSGYVGMTLNRNEAGRVVLAFGKVLGKRGDRVLYLDEHGHDWEREKASKSFKPGEVLTVSGISVGGFSSRYTFEGVAGEWNTVMFGNPLPPESGADERDGCDSPKGA